MDEEKAEEGNHGSRWMNQDDGFTGDGNVKPPVDAEREEDKRVTGAGTDAGEAFFEAADAFAQSGLTPGRGPRAGAAARGGCRRRRRQGPDRCRR